MNERTNVQPRPAEPLYRVIAGAIGAAKRCQTRAFDGDNPGVRHWTEVFESHESRLESIARELLPSGSGIDSGTAIDREKSTENRIVLGTSFHHMTDGMYDGWTEHEIIVTPSLVNSIDVRVTGRNRNDIKDYLSDLFADVLTRLVRWDDERECYRFADVRGVNRG